MIHPTHLHPKRYIFHGRASGVAAHIRRPKDVLLPVQGCAALPVIGGHSECKIGPKKLSKLVSFKSALTSAHGDYVKAAEGVATTRGKLPFHKAATETRVTARVRGLEILGRVHIADLSLGLVSHSAIGAAQPPIFLEGNFIKGVRIDDAMLKIELAEGFFTTHDTKDKLKAAHKKGLPEHHARMFLPHKEGLEKVTSFPEANGIVKVTIVQSLEWVGKPHPTATIHGHVVEVPNFGKLYFGEMFITGDSRRLTLVRFQLGSPVGGECVACDGETNGSTVPPTGG
jgi:hypothetical protein